MQACGTRVHLGEIAADEVQLRQKLTLHLLVDMPGNVLPVVRVGIKVEPKDKQRLMPPLLVDTGISVVPKVKVETNVKQNEVEQNNVRRSSMLLSPMDIGANAEMTATLEEEIQSMKMNSCVEHSRLPVWMQDRTGPERLQDLEDLETHTRKKPELLLSS